MRFLRFVLVAAPFLMGIVSFLPMTYALDCPSVSLQDIPYNTQGTEVWTNSGPLQFGIRLTWKDSHIITPTSVEIWRRKKDEEFTKIGQVRPGVETFLDKNVNKDDLVYEYMITSIFTCGASLSSHSFVVEAIARQDITPPLITPLGIDTYAQNMLVEISDKESGIVATSSTYQIGKRSPQRITSEGSNTLQYVRIPLEDLPPKGGTVYIRTTNGAQKQATYETYVDPLPKEKNNWADSIELDYVSSENAVSINTDVQVEDIDIKISDDRGIIWEQILKNIPGRINGDDVPSVSQFLVTLYHQDSETRLLSQVHRDTTWKIEQQENSLLIPRGAILLLDAYSGKEVTQTTDIENQLARGKIHPGWYMVQLEDTALSVTGDNTLFIYNETSHSLAIEPTQSFSNRQDFFMESNLEKRYEDISQDLRKQEDALESIQFTLCMLQTCSERRYSLAKGSTFHLEWKKGLDTIVETSASISTSEERAKKSVDRHMLEIHIKDLSITIPILSKEFTDANSDFLAISMDESRVTLSFSESYLQTLESPALYPIVHRPGNCAYPVPVSIHSSYITTPISPISDCYSNIHSFILPLDPQDSLDIELKESKPRSAYMEPSWFSIPMSIMEHASILRTKQELFTPHKPLSREEFASIICRAFGLESDTQTYMEILYSLGIVRGRETFPGSFFLMENEPINRVEALTILQKALRQGTSNSRATYDDVQDSDWFATAVLSATAEGIVEGYEIDGQKLFKPDQQVTRAEAGLMLIRSIIFHLRTS